MKYEGIGSTIYGAPTRRAWVGGHRREDGAGDARSLGGERLTLDVYAQSVAAMGEAAAAAMGARFLNVVPCEERAMESGWNGHAACAGAAGVRSDVRRSASPRGESNS